MTTGKNSELNNKILAHMLANAENNVKKKQTKEPGSELI